MQIIGYVFLQIYAGVLAGIGLLWYLCGYEAFG